MVWYPSSETEKQRDPIEGQKVVDHCWCLLMFVVPTKAGVVTAEGS